MVKRPVLAVDIALAALCVLLHPSFSRDFKAALALYAAFCIVFPRPVYRYLFPLLGTAGLKLFASLGVTLGSNIEADYFLFILSAILWAAVPTGSAGRRRGAAYVIALGTIGFAAVAFGFLFLWLLDRAVPPLGPVFLLNLGRMSSRLHLAAVGSGAILFFLVLWRSMNAWARRGSERVNAYTEAYLVCRRPLRTLGRKWQC